MLAKARSAAVFGMDAYPVDVEVDVAPGLPAFTVVGLPDPAVQEARERVRAAIKNSNFEVPARRITVNLAPADTRKEGPAFDLPMALGVLAATGQVGGDALARYVAVGELSLDGAVRPVAGVLAVALAARALGTALLAPAGNAAEAGVVDGLDVYPVATLLEAARFVGGEVAVARYVPDGRGAAAAPVYPVDFAEVKGQSHARRALEIAAAGGHNVLMVGPPGSGKTMLARRLATILPPLSLDEALEVTRVYSVAGLLPPGTALLTARPFRGPHHTASHTAMAGGGSYPRPGEVSLAHHGVLFLDELPEFGRDVLEVLRQPLEDGTVTISRVQATVGFPARVMLVAAMNPCPCGYYGDAHRQCTCTPAQIHRYAARISGPLLDRIDLHVEAPRLRADDMLGLPQGEPSEAIRARVERARAIQHARFAGTRITCNAAMTSRHLRAHCALDAPTQALLRAAIERLHLSARAYDRVLKLARTIADLEGSNALQAHHVAEAVQYRGMDRARA